TPPNLLLCDKIFRFRFADPTSIDPEYLEQVLKSPALREQIERGASGTSPTMKNISKAKIMRLRIPVPPLPLQRGAVQRLQSLGAAADRLAPQYGRLGLELDALLPSILDKAFNGEL